MCGERIRLVQEDRSWKREAGGESTRAEHESLAVQVQQNTSVGLMEVPCHEINKDKQNDTQLVFHPAGQM